MSPVATKEFYGAKNKRVIHIDRRIDTVERSIPMYYVYLLQSQKDQGWYIGFTNDLRRRLQEHNRGDTESIRSRRPFALIYYEAYLNQKDAIGRERFLKSGSGHRFLKKQLVHFIGESV